MMANETNKRVWQRAGVASAIALGAFIAPTVASAAPETNLLNQLDNYGQEGNLSSQDQLTSVFQLRDVPTRPGEPGFWAFDALKNLVEKYGCISGFPQTDGTFLFRGERNLTRYEFAAALNACLQKVELLIETAQGDGSVTRNDLATLFRLQEEFSTELNALGGRIDGLEGRIDAVEDAQFSTTTKLGGEVVIAAGVTFGEDAEDEQIALGQRTTLELETSFTGRDSLVIELRNGNQDDFVEASGGINAAALDIAEDIEDNQIVLDALIYSFPIGERITVNLGPVGQDVTDVLPDLNPDFADEATQGLSTFVLESELVYGGPQDVSLGVNVELTDNLFLDAYYGTTDGGADPTEGIFAGDNNVAAQLTFAATDNIDIAFTYARTFQQEGNVEIAGTGSDLGIDPFEGDAAAVANRFGLETNFRIGNSVSLSLWGAFANAEAVSGDRDGDEADLFSVAGTLAILDLGKEGNVLGLAAGIPPRVTSLDGGEEDPDTSFLVELHYRYQINDNIQITPGIYGIFNPNHNSANADAFVGIVRTTFLF
ncbi:MAG: iron uptake porin [Cyanobacteria bacterium J06641_5]